MFKLSTRSSERLATCHNDLQLIVKEALRYSPIDFGISHGHRTPEEQFDLFKKGRENRGNKWVVVGPKVTNCDGFIKKSKHNHDPSLAVDIYCWPKAIMYDAQSLATVGGLIMATANRLYDEGRIRHKLRWGNDWDGDGVLVAKDDDERFIDAPHFELIT